jgi:chemotaxis protein MotB
MKRTLLISGLLAGSLLLSSCVTKQKYAELEESYKICSDNLAVLNQDNINTVNQNKQLEQQVENLKARTKQLSADTLTLSKKLAQSEKDLAKAIRDYDDLLKQFAELNMTNNTQVNKLLSDIEKIKAQLNEREAEINQQRDELNLAAMELSDKESRLSELQSILNQKDAEVRKLKETVSAALKGFEGSGLNVYEKNGKVYVSMDEKLLFASGSWVINSEGMQAISTLADVLAKDENITVLIEGHTDNVPYKGAGQVKDNWDLSVLRATAVVKAILKNTNINPSRLSASGRSEYFPIDTNDTPEARAKNRRTEIILTPKLDELFRIINQN